jgi:hypothetical protein
MQRIAMNVVDGSPCCTASPALRASSDAQHFDTKNAYKNDVLNNENNQPAYLCLLRFDSADCPACEHGDIASRPAL